MGVVSKSGSGGISRICPLVRPTTDIRRGERHVLVCANKRLAHRSKFGAIGYPMRSTRESVSLSGVAARKTVSPGRLRQGPVTSATIKGLLDKKEIDSDAQVWRKGMSEWKSPRESDLAELCMPSRPIHPSKNYYAALKSRTAAKSP